MTQSAPDVERRPAKRKLNPWWRPAFLVGLLLSAQGCTPLLVVGSAVGFGVSYYWDNVPDRTFTAELPKVWDATLKALDTMAITVGEKERDERQGKIQATTEGLKIDIVLTAVTPSTTRVSVDAAKPHFTRDRATAAEIVEQISIHLEKGQVAKNGQKNGNKVKAANLTRQTSTNGNGTSPGSGGPSPGRGVGFVEIKVAAANIRDTASMDGKVLAVLPQGARLEKIADKSGWVKVRLSTGAEGYISQRLVQEMDDRNISDPAVRRSFPVIAPASSESSR